MRERILGLAVLLLVVGAASAAGAQLPIPGDCAPAALPDGAPTPTIATMVIPLLEEPAATPTASIDDGVNAQYCYWRELTSCGSCAYYFTCWLWYGSANQYGRECIGRRVEYCDGHPTGNEVPVLELQCGCSP